MEFAQKCSSPLARFPKAARGVYSTVISIFYRHPSTSNGDAPSPSRGVAPFRTPQPERSTKITATGSNGMPRRASASVTARDEGRMTGWQTDPRGKALLRSTWSDDFEDLYDLGSDIYCYIFKHNPACRQLFPWISKYEGEAFRESKEFRAQALRFVQTIAHVVKNVYHMQRLESFLYDIGQRHVQYASRGFKPEYWDAFQDAMEVALTNRMKNLPELSEDDREEAIRVWRDIAYYIIEHMKSGYNDGLKGINRFPKGVIM